MNLHNTEKHGNIFLTEAQARKLAAWLVHEANLSENEGIFVNFDHDAYELTVDDGGDPYSITANGEMGIYSS